MTAKDAELLRPERSRCGCCRLLFRGLLAVLFGLFNVFEVECLMLLVLFGRCWLKSRTVLFLLNHCTSCSHGDEHLHLGDES